MAVGLGLLYALTSAWEGTQTHPAAAQDVGQQVMAGFPAALFLGGSLPQKTARFQF